MTRWTVEIGDEFEPEFNELHEDVRTEVLALSRVLHSSGRNWEGPAWTRSMAPAMPT